MHKYHTLYKETMDKEEKLNLIIKYIANDIQYIPNNAQFVVAQFIVQEQARFDKYIYKHIGRLDENEIKYFIKNNIKIIGTDLVEIVRNVECYKFYIIIESLYDNEYDLFDKYNNIDDFCQKLNCPIYAHEMPTIYLISKMITKGHTKNYISKLSKIFDAILPDRFIPIDIVSIIEQYVNDTKCKICNTLHIEKKWCYTNGNIN